MNNNQDNFSMNSQMNNPNPMPNMQNGFTQNNDQPLNVIPQQPVNNQNNLSNQNQFYQGDTTQQFINNSNQFNNMNININNEFQEDNPLLNSQNKNKFITDSVSTTNTSLNDNDMGRVDYSQDPKVQENLGKVQKNTVTITSEGKIFLIIIAAMLLFVFVMPYIFDLLRGLKY